MEARLVLKLALFGCFILQSHAQAQYVAGTMGCKYRIDTTPRNYFMAKLYCEVEGASLAILHDNATQVDLQNVIKQDTTLTNAYFWIGGQYEVNNQRYEWLDRTTIPLNSMYPNVTWAAGEPNTNLRVLHGVLLSNYNNQGVSGTFKLEAKSKLNFQKYICEKPITDPTCNSNPCQNGGFCVNIGCSYLCKCLSGFFGRNCEINNNPPTTTVPAANATNTTAPATTAPNATAPATTAPNTTAPATTAPATTAPATTTPSTGWGQWGNWGNCSNSCGPGEQIRTRTCPTGNNCSGSITNITRGCNLGPCNANIFPCSRSCGMGTLRNSSGYFDCNLGACPTETCPSNYKNRYGNRSHECCDNSAAVSDTPGINSKIFGGTPAQPNQWPWVVRLSITTRSGSSLCGGTIISKFYVLTAAHCVENALGVTVFAGSLSIFGGTQYQVQSFQKHPDYNPVSYQNDIAIIRIIGEITFTVSVKAIALPKGENVYTDLDCVIAGWGEINNLAAPSINPISNVLLEGQIRVLPSSACNVYNSNSAVEICAGSYGGSVDSCSGDSGGPMMCQRCTTCQWVLFGITSYGGTTCATSNQPGVYARVSAFTSWINAQTSSQIATGNPPFPTCPYQH